MRLGLIGAGRWGKRYIETLATLPGVQLVHLGSTRLDSRDLVPANCVVTPCWKDVAENESLDGVILATPPATHLELATIAIHAGIPVLVEKPMTLSVPDAHRLVDTATTYGVLAVVGHTHLFSAAFRKLKQLGKNLGPLLHVRSAGGNWGPFRADVPMLWDWGPHDIAMCLDLFESDPLSVRATRTTLVNELHGNGEAVEINLEFANGTNAEIRVSNVERQKQRVFEAIYANGVLVYDDLSEHKLVYFAKSGGAAEPVGIDCSRPLSNLVKEFCDAIKRRQCFSVSMILGLRVIKVLASCQSILEGKADYS